jgi:hypothetical protein
MLNGSGSFTPKTNPLVSAVQVLEYVNDVGAVLAEAMRAQFRRP